MTQADVQRNAIVAWMAKHDGAGRVVGAGDGTPGRVDQRLQRVRLRIELPDLVVRLTPRYRRPVARGVWRVEAAQRSAGRLVVLFECLSRPVVQRHLPRLLFLVRRVRVSGGVREVHGSVAVALFHA